MLALRDRCNAGRRSTLVRWSAVEQLDASSEPPRQAAVLAANIRKHRQQRGWSARYVAERCVAAGMASLTRSTLAKIESGVRDFVTVDEAAALANVFGMTPGELLGEHPQDSGKVTGADLDARTTGRETAVPHRAQGVVQTGDRAQAFVADTVALGWPSAVPAPAGGLAGLPKPPVRSFVGRDEQLAELDHLLAAGAETVVQARAVHGLGGVGKSELALQFAHARRADFPVVWWVIANHPEAIESGLAELTFRLHPDARVAATEEQAASWAVGWLQSHPGWLLVLDNVEHRGDVEPLLADLSGGHVLITTRRDVGWEDITDGSLRLEVLGSAAAVTLLQRLSGQHDAASAEVLATELGCLPLALEQAGAYLRETRTGMAAYLQRLRQDPARMLAAVPVDSNAERAVARVWTITLAQIAARNPTAVTVLNVLSCLAPDDLPRDVLTPLATSATDLDQALGLLASYSMVTLTSSTVTMHRLVQASIRAELQAAPEDTTDTFLEEALRQAGQLLSRAAPHSNPQTTVEDWPRWAILSPHVTALATHYATSSDIELANLLGNTAVFESTQGRFLRALDHQRRALAIIEATLGPDHAVTALGLDNLASTLADLGRADEAEPLQRRALAIGEAGLGPDHPQVATGLDNLAITLNDLGMAQDAEPLQRRALAITEAALGSTHPQVAIRLNNLALSLRNLGRIAEAEPLQRRALAITEVALSPDHPDVATWLDNLAITLNDLGMAQDAEPLQQRALAITEAALGPYHPHTATRLNNLALSLRDRGREVDAESLHRRALAITETVLDLNHPDTAARLSSLTPIPRGQGAAMKAQPLHRRVLAVTTAMMWSRDTPQSSQEAVT
ncbi:FxSxx-COOH system tetratricopeptide repeat protein [Paractinoplanes globisporus]|uniref:FxSxx-COOH system tetratricopeptide repeat protein n=2 Tax=Paractinoplanes globisporus TaxID=113565 RepID=A0ABW6WEM8_9ACTN|nr:FxSxx-COOH system tetratricopeptide repeat protein [Actinoplanes globisporus]